MELYELEGEESRVYMNAYDASTGDKYAAGTAAVLKFREKNKPKKKKKNMFQQRRKSIDEQSGF